MGFVELNALPCFDERERGDPAAVRRYRNLMLDRDYAFLRLDARGWGRHVSARAPTGRRELQQLVTLAAERAAPSRPVLHFRGRLDRPAFAEITEVSPLVPLHAATILSAEGQTLRIDAPALPARAEIRVTGSTSRWEIAGGDRALLTVDDAAPAQELVLLIACSLCETRS